MRHLFFYFFLLIATDAAAQIQPSLATLYPIKKNHLWGYMNEQGEVVLEPKYDAIADKNLRWNRGIFALSPYRLVEVDGKMGAIDNQGNEVVAPNWREIRPLSTDLFAVRSDTGFLLINAVGSRFMFSQYDDVQPIVSDALVSSTYFRVKKDTVWGIFDLQNGELIAPQFGQVKLSNPVQNYFIINEWEASKNWGLFNQQGQQIIPFQYKNITALHPNNLFSQNQADKWVVFDSLGQQISDKEWWTFLRLNEFSVGVKGKDWDWDWELYFFDSQKTSNFVTKYEGFANLSHGYITGKSKNKFSIIDSLGNEILPPTFQEIQPFSPPLFRVKEKGWGIYSLVDGMVVPTDYQVISPFENGLAKVRRSGQWGMVNQAGKEVIPVKFESFQREENFIKAFAGETMTMYEMSDSNTVVSEEFFEEVYNVRVGYNIRTPKVGFDRNDINAAVRQGRTIRRNFQAVYGSDTTMMENSNWSFEKSNLNGRYALYNRVTEEAVTPPAFNMVRHIQNGRLTMVFSERPFAENQLASYVTFPVDTACSMALFSHDLGKFITPYDMMGLRRHDFERGLPYAAFLDLEGKMGLIDRNGKQVTRPDGRPLRYAFIDEFQHGKTRVCKGGRIAVVENPEEEKIAISDKKMFTHGFFVTPTRIFDNKATQKFFYKKEGTEALQWGYIDSLGQTIIEPQYDFANQFLDSVAVNQKDSLWGLVNEQNEVLLDFIYKGISPFGTNRWRVNFGNNKPIFFNKKGHEVIGLKYAKFGGFFDEMCRVQMDSLWGYVDKNGVEIIPCQYENARNFSEGLAAVLVNNEWIFIDKTGKEILYPFAKIAYLEDVGKFTNGLCWYKVGKFYGYFDKAGITQIEPQFTKAFDFENGVARVVYNRKTGVIDTLGNWLLKPKDYEIIFPFDENGTAVVRKKFNEKSGLINKNGDVLTELKYSFIDKFSSGYARVTDQKGYGFVDTLGREIIPCIYKDAKAMVNGLAPVIAPTKLAWEYRNLRNEKAFKGEFAKAENFSEGLVEVQVHDFDNASKIWLDTLGRIVNPVPEDFVRHYSEGIFGMFKTWGVRRNFRTLNYYFCDQQGKNLFGDHYEEIAPFFQGTAPVKIANRWGVISRSGMMMVQPKYSRINQTENGLIHAMAGLISGLTDKQGNEILPAIFDEVRTDRNLIRVELGEKIGYVTEAGEWVWALQN